MIKGTATILFGSGSVATVAYADMDGGVGHVYMKTAVPGKIGRSVSGSPDLVIDGAEVTIYFTNVESLDSHIAVLNALRDDMIKVKQGG